MDSLDTLRIFLQVADLGGFARAAASLDLSKAAVSLAIQRLESQLGTQLFHRTTRKVQLTPDGHAFHERARDLLDDMDDLHGMFRREGHALKGRLRVDMSAGIAQLFVIPRLPDFLARHPGLSVEISATDRRVDVVREGFDCVIRMGALEESALVARPLGLMPMINCASPAYVQAHGMPTHVADLAGHRLVHFVGTFGQRSVGFEYTGEAGTVAIPMAGEVTVNNSHAYTAAALAGLGIVQAPLHAMQPALDDGRLVEVLPACRPPSMPVTLLYPHRRNLPSRVRVFMDWIAATLTPFLAELSPAAPPAGPT